MAGKGARGGASSSGDFELSLEESDRLPWLDADEEEEGEGEVAPGRIIGFALILLGLLVLVVGAVWWLGRAGEDHGPLLAEGSTIPAPEGPYKRLPKDAGGKQFEGTGLVAPAVGEGMMREGRLAERKPGSPVAAPVAPAAIEARPAAVPQQAQAPKQALEQPEAAAPQGVAVQVGAYGSRAKAEAGWETLRRQTEALNGVSHRIVKGQADIGTVYRLQAIAPDLARARALCEALKADGLACQVKR